MAVFSLRHGDFFFLRFRLLKTFYIVSHYYTFVSNVFNLFYLITD